MVKHAAIQSFLLRAAFAALGLWIATLLLNGLVFRDAQTLIVAALLLGVINAVVRPLVILLTLPITLVSMGLFLLVVNAGMLGLVAWLMEGFEIHGFGTALAASLIVSVCTAIASALMGGVKIQIIRQQK
ncbi:MAG: phage holin family protein [Steroidobacter sp.]